jgi:hypothetical protein
MAEPEIVGETILHQNGCFQKIRRWLKGIHPERGIIIRGMTGWETVQEIVVIRAITFEVVDLFRSVA